MFFKHIFLISLPRDQTQKMIWSLGNPETKRFPSNNHIAVWQWSLWQKSILFLFFSGCTILQSNTMQVYYHIKILATELSLSIWSNFKVFSWHSCRTRHHLSTWITDMPEKWYKTWSRRFPIRICKSCWAGWMHEVSTNIHSNFDKGGDAHLQILITK